jgi:hypothetical protein
LPAIGCSLPLIWGAEEARSPLSKPAPAAGIIGESGKHENDYAMNETFGNNVRGFKSPLPKKKNPTMKWLIRIAGGCCFLP